MTNDGGGRDDEAEPGPHASPDEPDATATAGPADAQPVADDAPWPADATAPPPDGPAPASLDAPDPADAASPPPPPATLSAAPGGVYPATYPPVVPPPVQMKPARRGLLAIIVAAAVAVFALIVKFGLPILIGTTASGLLDGVFGGPFERIPDAQRQALEQRFEAAFGDRLNDLPSEQVLAEVERTLNAGLPRLDDARLLDRLALSSEILTAADVTTCAAIARASALSQQAPEAMATAIGALPPESIGRWFEINMSAIEAEVGGSPDVRVPDQAAVDRIAFELVSSMDEADSALVSDLYGGGAATLSNDAACSGVRALYDGMLAVEDADRRILALYDVSP